MSADRVTDIAGCSTPITREIIVISDDEEDRAVRAEPEEIVYRDIFEVPQAAPPVAGRAPAYRSDEEGPEFDWDAVAAAYDAADLADEDPDEEWDEEAAAHDAAILAAEEQEDEDLMMEDSPASVPESDEGEDAVEEEMEDVPHQAQDSDDARVIGIVQAAAAEIIAARQETFQARMDAAAEAQAAAEERHALEEMVDAHAEGEAQIRAQLRDQLAAERERVAQLTESLEVARAAAQGAEARMARQHEEVASALRDLSRLVAGFSATPGQPAHMIRRDTVLRLITGASCRALQRF